MLEPVLNELVLEEDLHADDELALLLSCQVHFAELTTSQQLSNIEISDGPAFDLLWLDGSGDLAGLGDGGRGGRGSRLLCSSRSERDSKREQSAIIDRSIE